MSIEVIISWQLDAIAIILFMILMELRRQRLEGERI